MAGWDDHLAKLTSSVKCRAAMYGPDAIQWAGLTQVKATKPEIQKIISGFANPTPLRQAPGPTVEGQKYMTTRADTLTITLKYTTRGAVFAKSKQSVVACLFDESTTSPAQALIATSNFVDYLRSFGY